MYGLQLPPGSVITTLPVSLPQVTEPITGVGYGGYGGEPNNQGFGDQSWFWNDPGSPAAGAIPTPPGIPSVGAVIGPGEATIYNQDAIGNAAQSASELAEAFDPNVTGINFTNGANEQLGPQEDFGPGTTTTTSSGSGGTIFFIGIVVVSVVGFVLWRNRHKVHLPTAEE